MEKNTGGDRERQRETERCAALTRLAKTWWNQWFLRQVLVLETKHHNSDGCTMVGLGNREADPRGKQFSAPASNKQEIVRQEWAAQPNTTSTGICEAPGKFAALCFSLSPPDRRRGPNDSLTFAKAPDPSSRRIRVRARDWNKSRRLEESFFLRFFIYPCKAVCSMHFRTVEQLSLYNPTSFWISPSSYFDVCRRNSEAFFAIRCFVECGNPEVLCDLEGWSKWFRGG